MRCTLFAVWHWKQRRSHLIGILARVGSAPKDFASVSGFAVVADARARIFKLVTC